MHVELPAHKFPRRYNLCSLHYLGRKTFEMVALFALSYVIVTLTDHGHLSF